MAYIPQRPPFVFIDTIDDISSGGASTRFTVTAECPLTANGVLTLAGLLENAAQTCAVSSGGAIGYIGAVKRMEVNRLPHVGETLCTEAHVVLQSLNVSQVDCVATVNGEPIAKTTLSIALQQ